jgi:hypothetical protein
MRIDNFGCAKAGYQFEQQHLESEGLRVKLDVLGLQEGDVICHTESPVVEGKP